MVRILANLAHCCSSERMQSNIDGAFGAIGCVLER